MFHTAQNLQSGALGTQVLVNQLQSPPEQRPILEGMDVTGHLLYSIICSELYTSPWRAKPCHPDSQSAQIIMGTQGRMWSYLSWSGGAWEEAQVCGL